MARRKSGRAVNGWLILDKPVGMGSTEAVSKARWAMQARKAGHAGTLDPLASGLLAIAFGEATKTVPYAMDGDKCYRFTVAWGISTTTDDREGDVRARSDLRPDAAAIAAALPAFRGEVQQVPPVFSAIKVDGARAYDLARAGAPPELAPRTIRIDRLDLLVSPSADEAIFEMVCGKGGYVRSVARDLGEALGCLGHVKTLRRISAGPFSLENAVSPDMLERYRDDPAAAPLLPVCAGLAALQEIPVDGGQVARLLNGNPVPVVGALGYDEAVWASHAGEAIAVGRHRQGVFHPSRVLLTAAG